MGKRKVYVKSLREDGVPQGIILRPLLFIHDVLVLMKLLGL